MTTNQKPLRRLSKAVLFHSVEGKRVLGPSPDLHGNCTGLRGDCTGLIGDLKNIPISARPCDIGNWVEEGA